MAGSRVVESAIPLNKIRTANMSKSRKAKQDSSIMGTNNSSIVSKRSVERTYYPEPHFFRYFVKKPKARTPLINIGYWLRMRAVDRVVRSFLSQRSDREKVVVNLGCGYDPLPFQVLSRIGTQCQRVHFVDVDYPELIHQKSKVILETPQIRRLIGSIANLDDSAHHLGVVLQSTHYLAVAGDLQDLDTLRSVLRLAIDSTNVSMLFIAEVSLTYMDTAAADALLQWTAQFKYGQFCLIEQILPDGPEHPFARKMLSHFRNLNSPLKSVERYPTTEDQEERFLKAQYQSARARSLWQLWNENEFIDETTRSAVVTKEPFDEWEELIIFAQHYALVEAWSSVGVKADVIGRSSLTRISAVHDTLMESEVSETLSRIFCKTSRTLQSTALRRYGAAWRLGSGMVGHHGGIGQESRLDTSILYHLHVDPPQPEFTIPSLHSPRSCHTITDIGSRTALLVGGRTSPDNALRDCWIYSENTWRTANNLPRPLYRHNSISVMMSSSSGVLVFGGIYARGQVSSKWYFWSEATDWIEPTTLNVGPEGRFSSTMVSLNQTEGLLLGGLRSDCTICDDLWRWKIFRQGNQYHLDFEDLSTAADFQRQKGLLCRVGACAIQMDSQIIVVGGMGSNTYPAGHDILQMSMNVKENTFHVRTHPVLLDAERMLFIGHSIVKIDQTVAIIGGGATCFSFGTHWNHINCCLTAHAYTNPEDRTHKSLPNTALTLVQSPIATKRKKQLDGRPNGTASTTVGIPRWRLDTAQNLEVKVKASEPFVLSKVDIGSCTTEWTVEALRRKVGESRQVVVHESYEKSMNFKEKNFKYVKKPFGQFLDEISAGSCQYLRSLALHGEKTSTADLASDFPELAYDFQLPSSLCFIEQMAHSSPLRISGSSNMWLHYDVMANVLCQIRGSRSLRLYPPSDILSLCIDPGSSSSTVDVFDHSDASQALLEHTHPWEAVLEPGDILFIPPVWAHAAESISPISVAVNVFFRNLDSGYAAGRDVYGNRDLQAYENGRRDVNKMVNTFDKLPPDIRRFYLERLGQELIDLARHPSI